MGLLFIDTTSDILIVGVVKDGVREVVVIDESQKHSEMLLVVIEGIFNKMKIGFDDIKTLGCVTGPGSFTGIRVGIATIKAFLAVKNYDVIASNVFDLLSGYVREGVILKKSTSRSYYYSCIENSMIIESGVVDINLVAKKFEKHATKYVFANEQMTEVLAYNNIETINDYHDFLTNFMIKSQKEQNFISKQDLIPYYLQLSQAEKEIRQEIK